MTAQDALAILAVVVALPVLTAVAWQIGRWSDQDPAVWVLRERAISALSLQFLVAVFVAVFVNNEQPHPFLDRDATAIITRSAVLALVGPAIYWFRLSRRHRRRGPTDGV